MGKVSVSVVVARVGARYTVDSAFTSLCRFVNVLKG